MDRFVIEPFGPYRFIGKSLYVRSAASDNNRGSDDICRALWAQSDWIFQELDGLEGAPDQPHKAALITWDAYTPEDVQIFGLTVGKTQLLGYCVGRFMPVGTPVPVGFDHIDIPAGVAAKGWSTENENHGDLDGQIREKIDQSDRYKQASWRFMAEIFPEAGKGGSPAFGYYMSCEPLTAQEVAEKNGTK